MIAIERLERLVAAFPRLSIALVGDLFLDRYLEIEPGVEEPSIETGLEAYQVTNVRNSPGALGTVMNNLAALGVGLLVPVTVIGDDGHGFDLLRALRHLPVDTANIVCDPRRLTPTYTKPLKQDSQAVWRELNRIDVRTRAAIAPTTTQLVCERLRAAWNNCDGLIVLDQINETNWGVVNQTVRDCLRELAAEQPGKLMFVDSRTHLSQFDFGTLKGNRREITDALGLPDERDEAALIATQNLCRRTGRDTFCTLGERGIAVGRVNAETTIVPGCPVAGPVDIVGAGDSATSGIVTTLLAGGTALEAAAVGNLVASITVQQLGTTGTAKPSEVIARCQEVSRR